MGFVSKAAVGRHVSLLVVVGALLAAPVGSANLATDVLGAAVEVRPPCQGGLAADRDLNNQQEYAETCSDAAQTAGGELTAITRAYVVARGQDAIGIAGAQAGAVLAAAEAEADNASEAADAAVEDGGDKAANARQRLSGAFQGVYCSQVSADLDEQALECWREVVVSTIKS